MGWRRLRRSDRCHPDADSIEPVSRSGKLDELRASKSGSQDRRSSRNDTGEPRRGGGHFPRSFTGLLGIVAGAMTIFLGGLLAHAPRSTTGKMRSRRFMDLAEWVLRWERSIAASHLSVSIRYNTELPGSADAVVRKKPN
jgi:hypothetical protein